MFEPGKSGNPSGRPKAIPKIRDLARSYSEEAILLAVKIMRDEDERGLTRLAAINVVLDRAWGKPMQGIEVTENKPVVDISNIPDDAVQAYHLVKEGRAKIVLLEQKNKTK